MLDSVRVRITLWYVMVLALLLVVLAVLTYFLYWRNVVQHVDTNLSELAEAYLTTLNSELPDHSGQDAVRDSAKEAMLEHRFRDDLFVVLDANSVPIVTSLDLPGEEARGKHAKADILEGNSFLAFAKRGTPGASSFENIEGGKDGFRAFRRPFTAAGALYTLVVLQSLHPQKEMMDDISDTFLWAIPLTLLLASAGGYFLARKSLSPVVDMASQAQRIGAENLQERLLAANPRDELGHLAGSFNALLQRLEDSFARQRRFMADASHELRTPVAILRGEADVALSKQDRSSAEYRESLAILREESKRLAHIVEDLFTLARADAGQYPLSQHEFYLDELATDVLRRTRSLALPKQIELHANITKELPIVADESLLRRLLLNLLDNAIKYTPSGGTVAVTCGKEGNQYVISVTDSGPGIPPDKRDKIFERFYRVDEARSRGEGEQSGAGLGLPIARWIAEAHDGKLLLTRSESSGSTFSVYLPVPA